MVYCVSLGEYVEMGGLDWVSFKNRRVCFNA